VLLTKNASVKILVTNIAIMNESAVKKVKSRIKYFYQKSLMLEIRFKETGTIESKERYYDVLESLDFQLDIYYSNILMLLKSQENDLFQTLLSLPKEKVKRNMLSELIKEFGNDKKNEPSINDFKFNIHTELKK
jgi:tRNA isopentenyl-2-thiomethyl-A-37 hydroxylase MiaE